MRDISDDQLAQCSNFNHLILFNKPPFKRGGKLLHIPTTNYKYDLYFHVYDDATVRVSLWRYFSSSWHSEEQEYYLISKNDYLKNIHIIDDALSKVKVNLLTNCAWLEQSDLQAIFKTLKKVSQNDVSDTQIDMFA